MPKIVISRDEQVLQEVELHEGRMILGRRADNDIVIEHRAVSGQHAAFEVSATDVVIEDQGSTNGTFVNGRRIERQVLADGDRIVIAKFQIAFVAGATAVADPVGSIEVVGGANAGKKLTLLKPVSTLGRPGVQVVAITRLAGQFFIHHVEGAAPQVNGAPLGPDRRRLMDGDCIELVGASMVFRLSPS